MSFSINPSEIGVVIQGPIQSVGRKLTDLTIRQYDVTHDVKKMLKNIVDIGAIPVVVTWDDQNIEGFSADEIKFIERIPFPKASIWTSIRNDWNRNSKYRQYYSTLAGVRMLKLRGCKYILKIRTDNLVDINYLITFVLSLSRFDSSTFFYSPLINLDKPHMFFDFYCFASITTLERFCRVILDEKERTTNIHFDIFYRWTMHQLGKKLSLTDIPLIYPKYPYFTEQQLRLIRIGLKDIFRPLPKEVWTTLCWRGEVLGSQGLKNEYRFAETPIDSILSEFDNFEYRKSDRLNINYMSVPSFFITSRIELSLNQLLLKSQNVKRKLLQLTRKVLDS